LGRLEAGDRVGLRVKVNTAKTVNLDKGGRVVRVRQARAEEEIPGWFTERVSGAFADVLIGGLESGVERQRKVPIAVATIDATAVVADPEMMMRLVEEGLGKAKAFGCGLISVRPLRT
jgi:CRISPR system Cascade subunit CasE